MRRRASSAAGLLVAGVIAGGGAHAQTALQPYQMVRSLQLIQDRLADGDHAALPMQRKILQMTDAKLRGSDPSEFDDKRNFRALLVYAMSGGNPSTLGLVMSRLKLDEADAKLGAALLDYLNGRPGDAARGLAEFDPKTQPPDIAAPLALVRGAVTALDKPADSFVFLDYARLAAPGTLVEEAALRRTIALSIKSEDASRFLRAGEQYTRRFLRSPYASQFADDFIAGIFSFANDLDLERTATVISQMNAEQQTVVYLRIARRAAIERVERLVGFAEKALAQRKPANASDSDPRAVLYQSLAAVTSQSVSEVGRTLSGIDRTKLSANDRRLLDAAIALVGAVVAPAATQVEADDEATAELPLPEPAAVASPAGETIAADARMNDPAEATGNAQNPTGQVFLEDAKRRLETVDKFLKENGS